MFGNANRSRDYLQLLVRTLSTSRYQRKGPRADRVGRHHRHRLEDLEAWLGSDAARG